jgi:hypothetical protein
MDNHFFEHPILNSPYDYPGRHWELDGQGQPTQQIVESRRRAEFITPIPKPKKQKQKANQEALVFDEGKGLSTEKQQYDPTSIINELRYQVDQWRKLPSPNDWLVTPETARLLQHWEHERGWRAQLAYPKNLFLSPEDLPFTLAEIWPRLQALTLYGSDIFVLDNDQTSSLWGKRSGFDPAGLDYLIERGKSR